jgi:cadmium resistance protein CadD (predicted permease)
MEIFITILVAVSAFFATNLDDLFVLMAFFARKDFNNSAVILGQYIGLSLLILISISAYFFKFIIPPIYISLFGILPIVIGVKNLWSLKKNGSTGIPNEKYPNKDLTKNYLQGSEASNHSTLKVASVSFANGGDNIGVYAPLFLSVNSSQLLLTIVLFMVMIGLWCVVGYFMINNRIVGYKLQKYGHIILPFVLIFIGLGVLTKGGLIFSP